MFQLRKDKKRRGRSGVFSHQNEMQHGPGLNKMGKALSTADPIELGFVQLYDFGLLVCHPVEQSQFLFDGEPFALWVASTEGFVQVKNFLDGGSKCLFGI
jgi:hypothetical protein